MEMENPSSVRDALVKGIGRRELLRAAAAVGVGGAVTPMLAGPASAAPVSPAKAPRSGIPGHNPPTPQGPDPRQALPTGAGR